MVNHGRSITSRTILLYWESRPFRSLNFPYRGYASHTIQKVTTLSDWNLNSFRQNALDAQTPVKLPYTEEQLPRACSAWFTHDKRPSTQLTKQPQSSELRTDFWSKHESIMVPLELTSQVRRNSTQPRDNHDTVTFHRTEAPLKLLLTYLCDPSLSKPSISSDQQSAPSIYLAQCDLGSLPKDLQDDVPMPDVVRYSGRGDLYSSSLWLGRPPTYTPLHRDPNPNLLLQLAGEKVVRLFAPDVGNAIFEDIQDRLSLVSGRQSVRGSASFRGEEMMQGMERRLLHRAVWGSEEDDASAEISPGQMDEGYRLSAMETRLALGEALFIPRGWWHSVKGTGRGITASVNWWFR